MNKRISILLIILIITASIPMQSVYAFTPEEFIGNLDWNKMTDTEKWGCIFNFTVAEIGAVVNHDAASFIYGMTAMSDFMNNNNPDNYVKEEKITIPKDYVALVKQCIEEYAKEHEPYYMAYTRSLDDFQQAQDKVVYDTAKNMMEDSPSGVIALSYLYGNRKRLLFVDIGHSFRDNSPVKFSENQIGQVHFYDNETWNMSTFTAYDLTLKDGDSAIKTAEEFKEKADYVYDYGYSLNKTMGCIFHVTNNPNYSNYPVVNSISSSLYLFSKEPRRIRIFNTYGDMQNYTLGKRSVYYTSKYYNYVPDDLTVSLDDLQKEIDDLSKVIDELLKQITKEMDESEIEEILRQILEALKNQQGTGSGSGNGNVIVNVDMKETNNWLSKIYSKVSQIFDKMDSFIKDAEQTANDKIQESLDEIITLLKQIKGWTIADTIIDGVDAIADWADFIKDLFTDADSGVATISSTMNGATNLLKTKFPFCIPWDVYALISFLAHEPETPVFRLPVKIERLGIEEYIEVDMSQFKVVSDISRTLLTLIYCYALINLTMKIFPMTKEET